jgi:hypothetical protein
MRKLLCVAVLVLAAGPVAAHPGVGIVMDSKGNVFYTDLKQVWKIAPEGTKSVVVANVHTHELWVDAEDNLYGEHLWYEGEATDPSTSLRTSKWGHYVWRLSADGKLTRIIPAREGFRDDYRDFSFVRDRAGNMYWAERVARPIVIRKRAPDGTTTGFGAEAGLSDVRWMTATPEGTVYFIDVVDLVRIAPDGTVTRAARNLKQRPWWQRWADALPYVEHLLGSRHFLMGVWTDTRGNVYVAAAGAGKVLRVSPEGRVEVAAVSGLGWTPTGGLVAPNGDLWLLEYAGRFAARARRLRPDGREQVY